MAREFDEHIMRRALRIARSGEGFTSPNPMVGAVIVRPDGSIAGEGFTSPWGGPHAEVNAVASVADKSELKDCTIYVTLEPCSHYGKTPPCAEMLVKSGIRRCVVGAVDPFEKVSGRGIRIMREAGMEVTSGVLDRECRELNRRFMLAHTQSRVYVVLKWAESADRFMALPEGRPVALSDACGHVAVHHERSLVDAILVGTNTVLTDNPRLDCRLWPNRMLRAVVPDPKGVISSDANVMRDDTIVLRKNMTEEEIARMLYSDYGFISLMVEGGAQTLQRWIDSGIYDEIRVESTSAILGEGIRAPRLPDLPYTFTPHGNSTLLRWQRPL